MLMAMLAAHCSMPQPCPTEAELIAAVSRRDEQETDQLAEEMREGNPDIPVSIRAERIVEISDIACDQEWSDEPSLVNCRYRVRYPSRTVLEIAQIIREDGRWTLQNWLRSTLERR